MNWTKNLGTRTFSNFTIGFNRNYNQTVPYFQTLGVDAAAQLGIFGASPDPRNYGPPSLNFTNYGGLNDGSPSTSAVNTLNLSETVTYRRGKHNWGWGAQWSKAMTNSIADSNGRGTFTFSGLIHQQLRRERLAHCQNRLGSGGFPARPAPIVLDPLWRVEPVFPLQNDELLRPG